jgi:hypothetical protein
MVNVFLSTVLEIGVLVNFNRPLICIFPIWFLNHIFFTFYMRYFSLFLANVSPFVQSSMEIYILSYHPCKFWSWLFFICLCTSVVYLVVLILCLSIYFCFDNINGLISMMLLDNFNILYTGPTIFRGVWVELFPPVLSFPQS